MLSLAAPLVLSLAVTALPGCGEPSAVLPDAAPAAPEPEAAAPGSATQAAPPAAPPDVVLVVVDTLRADHLGVYGYERPTSPRLDAWAADAAIFERAYAHSSWTLASFTSLLTGQLPHEHQVGRHPLNPSCFGRLPAQVETLPERLQAAGYTAGAFVNNTFLAPEFGLQQGFSHWDWRGSSPTEIRSAEETTARALAWLDAQQGPTFAMLHYMEPHAMYAAPAPFRGTFSQDAPVSPGEEITPATIISWQLATALPTPAQRARVVALYDEEILAVDAAFGALLDGLAQRGRLERTVVVVTADHGEEFWEHGGFEHGHSLLGELTRVPLLAAGPGVAPGRSRTLVSHADLYRGLLGLAGLPAPGGGDLFALARLGPYAGPRSAVTENTLYGPPRTGIVTDTLRLDVVQDPITLSLWAVEPDGAERGPLLGQDVREQARPLHAQLLAARGSLEPAQGVAGAPDGCGAAIPDPQVFEQLKALGYLEDR